MTVSTELRVVCSYLVADLKSRDVLANLNNDAAGLVAGNDGHSRFEIAIVDVQICTANATGFHYMQSEPRFLRLRRAIYL